MTEERKAEADVSADPSQARTRATGGEPSPDEPDQNSTTGTTPNDTFVGRATGADVGYAGETGAERRAQAHADGEDSGVDGNDQAGV